MNSFQPLISVVIPVFNRAWQLNRALEALKNQTYKNFEVIVCDDGSTEDIASVVRNFETSLNISYLAMSNWGGPAKPRNEGLKIAHGQWISYLDSDDWWDSNRLAIMAQELSDFYDIYYHPLQVVRAPTLIKSKEKRAYVGSAMIDDPFKQMMLFGNPIPTSAVIVRKELLLEHHGMVEDFRLVSLEDFDCWLRLASASAKFHYVDNCLGYYWVGSDAISAISEKQIEAQKLLYLRHQEKSELLLGDQSLARQNYVLGLMYYRIGKPKVAFFYLKQAAPLVNLKLKAKKWALILISLVKMITMKSS